MQQGESYLFFRQFACIDKLILDFVDAASLCARQARETLNNSPHGEALRAVFGFPMRVFWKDRDLRYLGCNTLFAKDAGLSCPEEMIGKTDFDMSWKDQAELYRVDDQRVMNSNMPKLSYDEPQTTPDGGQIWLRTSKVPLCNDANETIGVLGAYEDITECKLAAQALEESELRFRTILDSAVDSILVADGQSHKFVIANRAICAMLGYTATLPVCLMNRRMWNRTSGGVRGRRG